MTQLHRCLTASVVTGVLYPAMQSAAATAQVNTGLDATPGNIVACNGRVGFRVLTVFDSTTLTTTVLPAQAESFFLVEGNTVVFRTFEGPEATDLNADADLDDRIVQYQAF
jgi:hypothetical protein